MWISDLAMTGNEQNGDDSDCKPATESTEEPQTSDLCLAEENDDVRIIPKLVNQPWMAQLSILFSTPKHAQIALSVSN